MAVYKDDRRTSLAKQIDLVVAMDRERLVRHDLGNLSFKNAEDDIDRLRRLMLRLRCCDFDRLAENRFQDCNRFVSAVNALFNRMQGFSPAAASGTPVAERNQIVEQCQRSVNESNDRLLIPFAIAGPTLQDTDQEIRLLLESAKSFSSTQLCSKQASTECSRNI